MLRRATNNLGAMTIRLGLSVIMIAGALAAACGLAEARTRALVVGAAGYPALPEQFHLKGPKNDVREIANTLVRVGVAPVDVTVLADGVEGLADGIAAPRDGTKAAILGELDRLAETSEPGDLVVFYFSGHGSQQPDENGDEQGGNDEIVLPYDVAKWEGHGIKNALVDDELDVRVRKLLDKGVDFFGIIDACHSATGFRAVEDDDTRSREIDPQDLGVPASALVSEAPGNLLKDLAADKPGRGRAAYFYAAQESEVALEKVPEGRRAGPELWRLHLQFAAPAQRKPECYLPHAASGRNRQHQARQPDGDADAGARRPAARRAGAAADRRASRCGSGRSLPANCRPAR